MSYARRREPGPPMAKTGVTGQTRLQLLAEHYTALAQRYRLHGMLYEADIFAESASRFTELGTQLQERSLPPSVALAKHDHLPTHAPVEAIRKLTY